MLQDVLYIKNSMFPKFLFTLYNVPFFESKHEVNMGYLTDMVQN
jgi:hypothetical protein